MIVKIVKPTPMIDHVVEPGEVIDGDKLLQKLIDTGRAEPLVEGAKKSEKIEKSTEQTTEKVVEAAPEVDKSVKKTARPKPAAKES